MATFGQKIRSLIGDSLGASIVEYNLEKAIESAKKISSAPQSAFYNPMDMFMGREWIVKQGQALTYQDLRRMAMNPIIGSIIQTRLNQVASFAVPQQSYYDTGFVIKARNEGDLEAENNTTQKAKLRDFVYTCGAEGYGDTLLETFLRKFLRDSLVIDQACAEVVWTRDKTRPAYFVAVDSGSIRLLKSYLSYAVPPDTLTYVQVMDDVIRAAYTPSQMIFGVRNPQTDIRLLGYGVSELETLIRTITLILNAERYNSSLLAQGGTQKGLLVVQGDLAAEETYFEAFKRDFREAIRNASDYWRAPILRIGQGGDVKWLPIDRSQRDMEYAQLFDFLVKQSCGVYQMAPEEINWSIGATGAKVNFEAQSGSKLTHSQQKGLYPLLMFAQNLLNINIVQRVDPRYKMQFVGLNLDRGEDSTIHMREVQNYKTINEVRASTGLPPIKFGDVILNNAYLKMAVPGFSAPRAPSGNERDVSLNPEFDTSRTANQ